LTAVRAAVLELLVPVLAAPFGIVLLDESVTERLAIAGPLVLLGVGGPSWVAALSRPTPRDSRHAASIGHPRSSA
jgi:hypothetical protein